MDSAMLRRQRHSHRVAHPAKDETLPLRQHDFPPSASKRGRHFRPCLRYALFLVGVLGAILVFGTIYSDFTARDPCVVLSNSKRSSPSTMPKLFHYQSKEDVVTDETGTWNAVLDISAKQTYPDIEPSPAATEWTRVYWSDESCGKLVHEHFPHFAETYDTFPHTIQRVDSCRYLILHRYGGIYADTDISLHSDEIDRLIPDGVGLVESPFRYNEHVQNSLMTATSRGHEFWDTVVEVIKERKGSDVVLSTTGPKMLDDAVARYEAKGGAGVHTLPCELFQRLPVGQWDTTFMNVLGREVLSRAVPMKGCGRYGDGKCEVTRHGGKASWTVASGRII